MVYVGGAKNEYGGFQMKLTIENDNIFITDIVLNTICNYRCSYCSPSLWAGKTRLDNNDILWCIDEVKKKYPYKQLTARFTGGEPTLNPKISNLLKELYNRNVHTHFITNGSRTLRWWKENQKYLSGMIVSVHTTYAEPDHIVDICKVFDQHKPIVISVLIDPTEWNKSLDNCYYIHDKLKNNTNSYVMRILVEDKGGIYTPYTEEQKQFLSHKKWNKLFDKKINVDWSLITNLLYLNNEYYDPAEAKLTGKDNFFGWKCYAGIDGCRIREDNSITRSACGLDSEWVLGNIKKRIINLPDDPVICNKHACICLTDMQMSKETIN